MATVQAQGISKHKDSSKVISGSNFYCSAPTGKLSFLNNLVGVPKVNLYPMMGILYIKYGN